MFVSLTIGSLLMLIVINIKSDSIVRLTNKVHLLSYTTMKNKHIFYYKFLLFVSPEFDIL